MNIEQVRAYCLSLPLATEDFPFDESTLAFRVMGKIFSLIDLESPDWFVLKCDPDYALDLRDHYPEITPAWHMNKKHWNQLDLSGRLPDQLVEKLICHSYALVVKKLPQKQKKENPQLLTVYSIPYESR